MSWPSRCRARHAPCVLDLLGHAHQGIVYLPAMSDEQCAVGARTIRAGERTRSYMSPKDGPRLVCALCRGRAERAGWVDPAAPGANVGRRQEAPPAECPRGG